MPITKIDSNSIGKIKNTILRPATTSNFQCRFTPPGKVKSWIIDKGLSLNSEIEELISLNCIDATLPGSTFATSEIYDDYTGVTERHAYRRQYDDRSDFTFIVDNSTNKSKNPPYNVLLFFEYWMQYIADEQFSNDLEGRNYFYRMNYPEDYQANYITITKFEKDYLETKKGLEYRFLQAYPLAINSIPVSYESSQVLQCTVSFSYTRYTPKRVAI